VHQRCCNVPTSHPTLLARLRSWQPGYLLPFCPPRLAVRTWYPVFSHLSTAGAGGGSPPDDTYNQNKMTAATLFALAFVAATAFGKRKETKVNEKLGKTTGFFRHGRARSVCLSGGLSSPHTSSGVEGPHLAIFVCVCDLCVFPGSCELLQPVR